MWITQEIGGSLGAVTWLLPSETASQIFILRKFLRRNHWLDAFGYFSTEELHILVWDVSPKFSEKKSFLDIVSQKQVSNDLFTSFAVAMWRRPLGSSSWKLLELTSVSRFLAYVTRPHKWRISVLAEKKLCEKKNSFYTRVSWWMIMNLGKRKCFL